MAGCTLSEYVSRYALRRDLKPSTIQQYRYTAHNFERWRGGDFDCSDFADDLVNRWLDALKQLGRASWYIASNRTRLCTLWRSAADDGLTTTRPGKIRSVRRETLVPAAWSARELDNILAACDCYTRPFPDWKIPPPVYWRAFVLTTYYLGLRLEDMLALGWDDISPRGVVFVIQNKTGEPIGIQLPVDARLALRKLRRACPHSSLVFGEAMHKRRIQERLAEIRKAAGLRSGGAQQLRRSGATAVEIERPGSAMAFLGHKTPGLAYRHYVDPRKIQQRRPVPPKIG